MFPPLDNNPCVKLQGVLYYLGFKARRSGTAQAQQPNVLSRNPLPGGSWFRAHKLADGTCTRPFYFPANLWRGMDAEHNCLRHNELPHSLKILLR